MNKKEGKDSYKVFLQFLVGLFVLILGITLTLSWFDEVIILFKGAVGIILALAGLFTLYALNKLSQ